LLGVPASCAAAGSARSNDAAKLAARIVLTIEVLLFGSGVLGALTLVSGSQSLGDPGSLLQRNPAWAGDRMSALEMGCS
jgi:hypothetical protein